MLCFFFSSRRRHTRFKCDWSSDVCSSDLAFHDEIVPVDITRKDRIDRACAAIMREARGTDAALPMQDALERGLAVDAFVIVTDNETWAGDQHPVQALDRYRNSTGIAAMLVAS